MSGLREQIDPQRLHYYDPEINNESLNDFMRNLRMMEIFKKAIVLRDTKVITQEEFHSIEAMISSSDYESFELVEILVDVKYEPIKEMMDAEVR